MAAHLAARPARQVLLLIGITTFLFLGPLGIFLHPPSRSVVSQYVTEKHEEWFPKPEAIPCDP